MTSARRQALENPRRVTLQPFVLLGFLVMSGASLSADPLSDLRIVLQRFPANTSFVASGSLEVHGDSQDVAGTRRGSTTFEAELGPSGLMIRVPPAALGAAENEAQNKKRNPANVTPTRTAMVALTVFDVIDALDAASMLLHELDGASLIRQTPVTRAGKAATLLRIRVKPTLAGSRFVSEPEVELRVWIDSSGVPFAAERDSSYAASFLFVKAGNVRKERWDFAVWGDHLYASHAEEEDRASMLGKSIVTSRSVSYVPR